MPHVVAMFFFCIRVGSKVFDHPFHCLVEGKPGPLQKAIHVSATIVFQFVVYFHGVQFLTDTGRETQLFELSDCVIWLYFPKPLQASGVKFDQKMVQKAFLYDLNIIFFLFAEFE